MFFLKEEFDIAKKPSLIFSKKVFSVELILFGIKIYDYHKSIPLNLIQRMGQYPKQKGSDLSEINAENVLEILETSGFFVLEGEYSLNVVSNMINSIRVFGEVIPQKYHKLKLPFFEKYWGKHSSKEESWDESIGELMSAEFRFESGVVLDWDYFDNRIGSIVIPCLVQELA